MSIKAESVSFYYKDMKAPALDSVCLEVKRGELALLYGKNAAGKSTLLRCLAGLARPSEGTVTIGGREAGCSRNRIGFAIQFPERMLFERTAFDDVAFGPRNMGSKDGEVKRSVEQAVDAVGLSRGVLGASSHSLSYGQKRLLAIACAIAHGPEYLFLDEPLAGLDHEGKSKIVRLIESLNCGGTTIVVASHDPLALLDRCSRLIALDGGRIVVNGPPSFANARRAGIASDTMKLAEALKETFSPEVLADRIAEAIGRIAEAVR